MSTGHRLELGELWIKRLTPLNSDGLPTAGIPVYVLKTARDLAPLLDEEGCVEVPVGLGPEEPTIFRLKVTKLDADLYLPGRSEPIPAGTFIGERVIR